MVFPDSHEVSRASRYSGPSHNEPGQFHLQGFHPLWPAFPGRSTTVLVCNSSAAPYSSPVKAFNPEHTTHTGLAYVRFRLIPFRSPLLGESRLLSVPPGTEMVHFPGLATPSYEFRWRDPGLPWMGCPIRKSSGRSLFAAHRSLSQLTTSFINGVRQGIHHMHFVA